MDGKVCDVHDSAPSVWAARFPPCNIWNEIFSRFFCLSSHDGWGWKSDFSWIANEWAFLSSIGPLIGTFSTRICRNQHKNAVSTSTPVLCRACFLSGCLFFWASLLIWVSFCLILETVDRSIPYFFEAAVWLTPRLKSSKSFNLSVYFIATCALRDELAAWSIAQLKWGDLWLPDCKVARWNWLISVKHSVDFERSVKLRRVKLTAAV